jgi:leader peptidase (prepilin peptidase) / N-methyltransferase
LVIFVTVWWLFFVTAVGLCVGSFLNVVVYRLPRGIKLSEPTWSFCPRCGCPIQWYDNLPVIGYLRLGGKCRACGGTISPRYAAVEVLTAMMAVLLLDAFFIGRVRTGFADMPDLNARLAEDWPIYAAHFILFASLIAMSSIDLDHYWIDIRFTHFAAICGVVLHTVWTPRHSREWIRPFDSTAIVCLVAFVGFAVSWLVLYRSHPHDDEPDEGLSDDEKASDVAESAGSGWLLIVPLAIFALLLVAAGGAELGYGLTVSFTVRAMVIIGFFVVVIMRESAHVRDSDHEIFDAIESEATSSRRRTLGECGVLLPAVVLGGLTVWVLSRDASIAEALASAIHWAPMGGEWQPVWGLSTAVSGYVIAAGIGWTVRVLSNLVFGKEAFATGDIHMMAAAGAVIGWPAVLIGFMLTCFLASLGWVVMLPIKKTRAIPLGPWLTVGFLAAVVFYEPLVSTQMVRNCVDLVSLVAFGGVR